MGWLNFITSCFIAGTKSCHISVNITFKIIQGHLFLRKEMSFSHSLMHNHKT